MHDGFVIQVKFDVEYLNWLLKSTSTLKYLKGTSSFEINSFIVFNQPRFSLGEFQNRHLLWRQIFLQFHKTD